MKKIVVAYGNSQYDVLPCFAKEIAQGFIKAGKEVILINLNDSEDEVIAYNIPVQKIDFAFCFNIPLSNIIPQFRDAGILEVTFYVDHPMIHDKRLMNTISRNNVNIFVDKYWKEYADRYYPACVGSYMLPHGGSKTSKLIKKYNERRYNIVMLGGYEAPVHKMNEIIAKRGNEYCKVSVDIINEFLKNETQSLEQSVISVFNSYGWSLEKDEIREFLKTFYSEDDFIRMYVRDAVVRALLNDKLSVHVFGNGWDNFEGENLEYLKIHKPVEYSDALDILANTKILLNATPTLNAGTHERIFSAMLNGAICFTNKSVYLSEKQLDEECVTYSWLELNTLPEMIRLILNNPDKAEIIAEHAKQVAEKNYTWEAISKNILKIVDSYKKENENASQNITNNYLDTTFNALKKYVSENSEDGIYQYMKRHIISHKDDKSGYLTAMMSSFNRYTYWGTLDIEKKDFDLLKERSKELKEHWINFEWLYNNLQDWKSKNVMLRIVGNWLDYAPDHLNGLHDNFFDEYFDLDIIKNIEGEVFVDLGSYIGDTVLSYMNNMPKYKKIYTYEASEENMKKVKKNTEFYGNIVYRQCAVGKYDGVAYLNMNDDTSANRINDDGDIEVQMVTLDNDIQEKITFLKMDIEGSETYAIEGAKNHIKNEHPKLAIACYHNNHDIWRLAKQINEIEPKYKFYLRYYGGRLYPSEYVLYGIYNEN